MAVKRKSSQPVQTVVTLTLPKNPKNCIEGQVCGITQWKLATSSHPKFYLTFRGPNPFDGRKNATFTGSLDKPLTLVYKNAGAFQFDIVYVQEDGSKADKQPFCMTIHPPVTQLFTPPPRCPPYC